MASDEFNWFYIMQIRHGQCGTPEVFEVERQQDVRSPVYYRLERIQDSNELSGYIHLKEFNARAKRDIVTGVLPFMIFPKLILTEIKLKILPVSV